MIDRGEVNRALAKAIAYKQCGNRRKPRSGHGSCAGS